MAGEVEIITSSRGKDIFVVDGFLYEAERRRPSTNSQICTIYARCTRMRPDGCKTRIIIINDNLQYHLKKSVANDVHNHCLMERTIKEAKIKNSMKMKVREDASRPVKQVYHQVLNEYLNCDGKKEENAAYVPTYDNVATILYRERAKLRPPLPTNLENLDLTSDDFTKFKGENFILFNTAGKEKMIGFCTSRFLEILCAAETIYMDGTFKVVPKIFYQLYTIHAFYRKQMFPFIYVLLPNKSENTYVKMLEEVKNVAIKLGWKFEPQNIMMDFELAAMNAARKVFPCALIKGCLFHYNQALWRNFNRLGLAAFKDDPAVMKLFRFTSAMALIKLDDFDEAWLQIAEDSPAPSHPAHQRCQDYMDYFVNTWLEGPFNPEIWNHHGNFGTRTTNHIEGWHNGLNKAIGKSHPNIYEFISAIQN